MANKQDLDNHVIATLVNPDFWFFQAELCKSLKAKYKNIKIHLYTASQEGVDYIKQTFTDGTYDSISVRNFQHLPIKKSVDKEAVLKESREWEKYLGIKMAELVMSNRIFGRGYSLGAYYYPKAAIFDKNDHVKILDIFNDEISYWKKEIEDKGITIFVNPGKIQSELCRKLGALNRFFVSSRFEDYYFWANDEFMLNPALEKLFKNIPADGLEPIVKEEGYINDMVFRKNFFKRHGFQGFIKKTLLRIKNNLIIFIKTKGKEKGAYLFQAIRRDWRTFRDSKKMLDSRYITDFGKISENPFFFFPLQTEPEWTMQVQSPEFFSQLWAIALCAKAMPCDNYLAVKEHIYPLGMRPDNFYDQIVDFKNVNMISAKIHGLKVMRNCQGVITINGTSGYEAAMMGIPVIILGTHCDYLFMDHVFHCPAGQGLQQAIDTISSGKVDLDKAKIDGAKFVQAIIDSSVRSHNYSMLHREVVPPEMVENAISSLAASL